MTTRTYVTKSGDTYEWEETPEVLEALKNLHQTYGNTNGQSESPKAKI
jgi:hypothetical protein